MLDVISIVLKGKKEGRAPSGGGLSGAVGEGITEKVVME